MGHGDEIWQVYAQNGEPIPGVGWEAVKDNPENYGADEIVGITAVFLYRFVDGELEFLWQKRSETVSRHPGYYDFSAGGHINLGEPIVTAAKRECFEEIGVKIAEKDFKFVAMIPFNRNRFAYVFAVDFSGREDVFSFGDGEVSEVKWVPYKEMKEFWQTKAKPPLRKDEVTAKLLDNWIKSQGLLG